MTTVKSVCAQHAAADACTVKLARGHSACDLFDAHAANVVQVTIRARLLSALTMIAVAAIVVLVILSGGDAPDEPSHARLAPANIGSPIKVGINPVAVAVGAGAIWVIDAARQTLIKVNPHTRAVVGEPRRVPGGGVWVSSRRAGTVSRIDPRRDRADAPIALGEGGLWVTNEGSGTLTPITTARRR